MTATVSAKNFNLERPAFGIAKSASSERGFPPGALMLEANVTIAGVTHTMRQVKPTAAITVPNQVTCGVSRALTATVSGANNALVSTRWQVDGKLLAASVTSVVLTGTHELAVRARDARGATTTVKKVVSCL